MHQHVRPSMKPFNPVEGFLTINDRGHLAIEEIDTVFLAEKYGTPLYVISEDRIRENFRRWLKALTSKRLRTKIFYALKANPLLAVCRILQQEGAGFEVGGPGELYIAELLGMPPDRIVLNGNDKSRQELRRGIEMGATINVDSISELRAIQEEAEGLDTVARIAFRINPDVRPATGEVHLELWTALRESKFGIDVESGLAYKACETAMQMKNINVVGLHIHLGSPVEDILPYRVGAERTMEFARGLKEKLGVNLRFINIGGGFAIPFKHKDGLPPPEEYAETVISVVYQKTREFGLNEPDLMLEPGGAMVGDAAILLLKVGMTKETPGIAKWVAVDGGANIILRASQEWYTYQFVAANKMLENDTQTVNIAGPLCYSGDVLARNRRMPNLLEGDILAALDVGAYTFTYEFHGAGSHPLPSIVLVNGEGVDDLIRRSETLADLVSKDMIPRRLLEVEEVCPDE